MLKKYYTGPPYVNVFHPKRLLILTVREQGAEDNVCAHVDFECLRTGCWGQCLCSRGFWVFENRVLRTMFVPKWILSVWEQGAEDSVCAHVDFECLRTGCWRECLCPRGFWMFENRVLKRVFVLTTEVTEGWGKRHNEEPHNLYFSKLQNLLGQPNQGVGHNHKGY
jgi:hypothetical protein